MPSLPADESVTNVKSALLPLTRIDALLEALVEHLPRRRVSARLVPASQITVLDAQRGEFKSSGGNPFFELQLVGSDLDGAWVYIEGALARNSGSRQARLEGTLGGGLKGGFSWPVSTNLRGTIREVVYLPRGTATLRWVPTSAPGFFTQSPLLVHRIGRLESAARRLHRVLFTLGRLRQAADSDGPALTLWGALVDLQGAYRRAADIRSAAARGDDYPAMLLRLDRSDRAEMHGLVRRVQQLPVKPVFSLIVVLQTPSLAGLAAMIRSVAGQAYPQWELCLVVDKNLAESVRGVLQGFPQAESKARCIVAEPGSALAVRMNLAAVSTGGDYVCLLGQHDILQSQALLHLAVAADRHPEADIFYGDEDCIDHTGRRFSPSFKPDWNPDLFLACNYVGTPVFVRRARMQALGFYRAGVEGAETFDLVLRLLGQYPHLHIHHVSRVVCSRRLASSVDDATTVLGSRYGVTPATHAGELAALNLHLQARNARASNGFSTGFYRVHHPLPERLPLVTLVVPTRDRLDVLRQCIASVQSLTDYPHWEMLVVDNGSTQAETLAYLGSLADDPRIRVLRHDWPFNYSELNNHAVGFARGEVLGLLNNDLEVITADWLTEMVSHAVRPEIGAVGAKLLYPDGTVQHAGVVLGIGGVAAHVHKYLPGDAPGYCGRVGVVQNLSAVTGACLVVRTSLYRQVGGMNAANLAVAFNDIDLCLKLRDAGYRNIYTPHALLYHHESISRGRDDTPAKRDIFEREFGYMQRAWREKLCDDPAYNPNLTLEYLDFSLSNRVRTPSNGY